MAKLEDIEGIGATYAGKLREAGVTTQESLLAQGGKPDGRKALAESTGISGKLLLGWINRADLARIKGVGEEYADLLERAGVDSVPELAQRNAANLHAKLEQTEAEKNLVRRLPSADDVARWVTEAKDLPRAVFH